MSLPGQGGDAAEALTVLFDGGLYRAEAVKRAAYKFSTSFACEIRIEPTGIACTLTPLKRLPPEEAASLVSEFKIEVLDQDLRLKIAEETAPLRAAILGYAFSRTGLQGE